MAAPDYVPPLSADRPRETLPLPPARRWTSTRPADLAAEAPRGPRFGSPGPDQGYGLSLALRFVDQLRLEPGEHTDDVLAGCVAVALRRASIFGRAPVIGDLALAFGLFGYLDDAPPELVRWRRSAFKGASHDYWEQRHIVDRIPEPVLQAAPSEVRSSPDSWKAIVGSPS